jgi:hypothetical protein
MAPSALPLLAIFGVLGVLTYYQVGASIERTRQSHRPHGLLGPAVNEFVRDRTDVPAHERAPDRTD